MAKHLATPVLFMLVAVATAPHPAAVAAPPAASQQRVIPAEVTQVIERRLPSFDAAVTRFIDADSFWVMRDDKLPVKVRLKWADTPEVAHRKNEADQPGGREAMDWAEQRWTGERVTVYPKGYSYDRLVAVVSAKGDDMTTELVTYGHAWLDRRYKPRKQLRELEAAAKKMRIGLWADDNPVPPWEWRKKRGLAAE